MKISELWNKYKGQEAYIIGTGPSLRLFPSSTFDNKLTIGLNEAWKLIDCTFNLTIHPKLIPEDFLSRKQTWITKHKDWLADKDFNEIYWFKNNRELKNYNYVTDTGDTLYVSRGIHTGAIVLGAKMGLSRVFLCGVDCHTLPSDRATQSVTDALQSTPQADYNSLSNNFSSYGHSIDAVCKEYYLAGVDITTKVKTIYGMDVFSLSPYFAPAYWKEEHIRITKQLNLPNLSEPKDSSPYHRPLDFQ